MNKFLNLIILFQIFFLTLVISCATTSKTAEVTDPGKKPSWVGNPSSSKTYFIGIGNAKVGEDLNQARMSSRKEALADISEQIRVRVVSDVKRHKSSMMQDDDEHISDIYSKKIETFTEAVLTDWIQRDDWVSPEGKYWCKIVLEKAKYYAKVNEKIYNAITLASDALRASYKGSVYSRIQQLLKGLEYIGDFLGNPMKAYVSGKKVILNNEIPRQIANVLEKIEIKPRVKNLNLSAVCEIPDTVGVYLYFEKIPENELSVLWASSDNRVKVKNLPHTDNFYPVEIKSIPSSAGIVTITAIPDFGEMQYTILQKKIKIPSGSFTMSRQIPKVYVSGNNTFVEKLANKLSTGSAVSKVDDKSSADFILSASCAKNSKVQMIRGIYKVRVNAEVKLISVTEKSLVDMHESIIGMNNRNPENAFDDAYEKALNAAVKRIEEAF